MTNRRRLLGEHLAALDLEQAAEENRAYAALTVAMAVSRFLRGGLIEVPDVLRDLVQEYNAAHERLLAAREVEQFAGEARAAAARALEGGADQ